MGRSKRLEKWCRKPGSKDYLLQSYLIDPDSWITDDLSFKPILHKASTPQKSVPASPSNRGNVSTRQVTQIHNPDQEGLFLLHHAATKGDLKEAERLLKMGAATEVKDRDGNTPFISRSSMSN